MIRKILALMVTVIGCSSIATGQTVVKTFSSEVANSKFGIGVHKMPDVSADSVADFLIVSGGSSADEINLGKIEIISGRTHVRLLEIDGTVGSPVPFWSSKPLGDVNGDSIADILVGDPTLSRAAIYSGANGTKLQDISGEATGDGFGYSVAALPDINVDGVADFAVGAPNYSQTGKTANGYVRFFSGADGAVIDTVYGDGTNDHLGTSIAYAGDVNNDSVPDLAAGAPEFGNTLTGKGYVRVYSAANRTILMTIVGPTLGSRFGTAVAAAGDINSDNYDDLLVGAPLDRSRGSVFVHSGNGGTELYGIRGASDGDFFGSFVVSVGDVNSDSIPDFIGGASAGAIDGNANGYFRIYSGATGASYKYFKGKTLGGLFGYSVASVGDVDVNGTPNILIGSPGAPSKSAFSEAPDGTVQFVSLVTSLSSQDPETRGSKGQPKTKKRNSRNRRAGRL